MVEQYLHDLYYNPKSPASFGGVDAVYRTVKIDGKFKISRNRIKNLLKQQDTYTLHKPVRHRFKRNKVIVGAMDEKWKADLVIMYSLSKSNNGILTVIDVLSINVPKAEYVLITGDIATTLGFEQDTVIEKETISPYVADVNGGFLSMYVNTDIVDAQFVGDVKVPLLRIFNTKGNYGDNVNVCFRYMQYVPIKVKSFETVEINIKDDKNENVSFRLGKSIETLHFKQRRSQYFIWRWDIHLFQT